MSQRSSSKLTTRTNYSESASSENQPYADTLANKLLNLHEENIQIGKQNQELSVRLHEVTTYNQALGLDIYKLDNQINDLEEKIESHREKTTKILHQTEIMNKKTETCKNLLNRNEQMSDLAKKFQKISHFKEKADKNVQELHKLFEDSNYEKIANSFDIIAEKIHFLYWNNNELNEQISMLEKLVTEKENTDRAQFKSSWEERRIDTQSISQNGKDIKSESSPASGASIRAKMKKRIQNSKSAEKNLKSEEGESPILQAQSDASKKNEYFISSDSMENEFQKKKNINNPQQNNDQQNSLDSKKPNIRKNRKGKKSRKPKNSNENDNKGENEYETNEYEEQKQIKFNAENMTPRKNLRYRKQPSPKSASKENEKDDENHMNDDMSPNSKSSSTTYSKSSSKSTHSDKSNQPQSPNSCMDTSSQLADSSNSNNSNNNDEYQQIQLVHSNYKAPYQSMSDTNDFSRNGRRLSRRKRAFPQKNLDQIKDSDSEYDFYESEPPPNPKKGMVRGSKNDSEYEYEYYDPDDEIADDENEYDFVDENSALPKVIISRPKYATEVIENKKTPREPEVITNYTECEYHLLNITKLEPVKFNSENDEKLIKLNSKYDEDENVNHNCDKSEYIYVKKSEKTMKEDQIRKKQREFVPVTRIPKITREELRQEKNDIFDEEQIKKYEENALRCALEDEENAAQIKIEEEAKAKDEEEQFIKKCFKNLRKLKKKKREKMEKMKDDEIQLYKKNRKLEKIYMNKVTEITNMNEERELNKAIEEEKENLNKINIIKKAKQRIENRKKEEEAIKEQENIQKLHKKEMEEKRIEEKRIKARKFKEEELQKLKQKENEKAENKEREKQKRLYLLKLTREKEKEKIENERKKKEKEDLDNKERERLAIEDMARRRQEKEIQDQQEKEYEKIKRANEVQILKSKIMKYRQLKEKEKKEKEEEKNNEQEVELIKQKLREKRRRERELREEERIERERKDRELRELYEGIFDVPVKRIFDKDEKDNDKNNNEDDSCFRNSRLGNDRDGFLSDSAGMSASDSMAELDVAAPISLEERKLAELHDKNPSHSHSNCRRIKVRKNKNGNESEYEYEYEYEYECEDDEQQSKSKSRSNSKLKSRSKSGLNNHDFSESETESVVSKSKDNRNKQVDEEEAEQNALQEQQRLQQLLKQMDSQNNKEKGKNKDKSKRNRPKSNLDSASTSKFESDSSILDASHHSPKGNNKDDSLLNYSYKINDYNSASNSSDVIQYSDDDYFPRPKEIIKTRSNKNDDEDDNEYKKNKNSSNDENNKRGKDLIINEKNRPLRKKKTEKPKFVPEFYNLKQQPKYKPVVVGTIKNSDKNSNNDITKMGTIVNEIENPEIPKPILIENCKIKHPGPVQIDAKNFQIIKTPEQIRKEKEEKAAREERERLHAERAKKFRHSIDANGKEYEYDYEYDYEYETENENKKEVENSDTNNLHATYRDSTDFLKELSNEVANANAVIRQTTDAIKHEEQTNEKKDEEEEDTNDSENKKEKNKVKKVRTGRKIKKLPSTAKPSQIQIKLENQNNDNNDNNNAGIKRQRSVTFANNPALENENQVNFNPSANNTNRTPQKRMANSARRQRNSPGSPIDPTISPTSKQRLSNRRNFSDMNLGDNNNNEEEEEFYEDEYEQIPKPNNLLVEIDSRPDTPRKPQQPNSTTTPDYETPNVPELDLSKIKNYVDDEYEYEYEYEYENDNNKKDSAKSNKNKIDINDNEKQGISESGSSTNNNLLLKKDNSEEDFTENEKTFDSHSNFKLQNLVKQVRADAASLSNEDLQNILAKIKAEVEIQLESNTELEEKLQELEKIRDKKVPKKLSNFSTQILEFDPIIYENKYHSSDCQTEVPGEFIKNIEATLQKQNKEKQEMIAVQKRIEAAQQQVINTDSQIKSAEKLTIEKKQSIENLKAEIIKVKEEIAQLNYDTTQDDVQAKQCEIEIEKLDTQVQQQQQKLEKVSHTIEELRIKLQEMINYRAVLDAELNDIYNREKPEVRKLIDDVRNTKQSSEEAQTKITQLQKKIATRRDEINKLKKSQERKKNDDLRLVKEKLSRRLNKWTVLNNSNNLDLKCLQEFSLANASQREKAKSDAYANMKKNWCKNDDVESITKYADLLENIVTEYNKQTVT